MPLKLRIGGGAQRDTVYSPEFLTQKLPLITAMAKDMGAELVWGTAPCQQVCTLSLSLSLSPCVSLCVSLSLCLSACPPPPPRRARSSHRTLPAERRQV